jgi:hypothetical protein
MGRRGSMSCCGDPLDCHEAGVLCGRRVGESEYVILAAVRAHDLRAHDVALEESRAELEHGAGESCTRAPAGWIVPRMTHEGPFAAYPLGFEPATLEESSTVPAGADPDWVATHSELLELHVVKSSTYGDEGDRFRNFTDVAHAKDEFPEEAVLGRIIEKASRSLTMLRSGRRLDVGEYGDMSSLALIAEALRRKAERGEL